jgi:hypothetical protein
LADQLGQIVAGDGSGVHVVHKVRFVGGIGVHAVVHVPMEQNVTSPSTVIVR